MKKHRDPLLYIQRSDWSLEFALVEHLFLHFLHLYATISFITSSHYNLTLYTSIFTPFKAYA